jgi:outer membrane receptor protein involved in Fe transport
MHKKYLLLRDLRPLFTLAGVAVSTGLAAQPAPADAGAAAANNTDEDLYVLSPFEVTSSKDTGYVAAETLAGTRIRTDLKDVGSAISVVTKEMMNDIGATDNATLLQYTTNAEVAGTRGTYAGLGNAATVDETGRLRNQGGGQRVRGLDSADNTRDFFATDIPWDGYNIDRIDIQRGPNSMLFGLGSPAGIINASMRNAQYTNSGSAEFRFGSYGSARGSLDVNRQIIDNVLAVRVDGLWNNEKYEQKPAFQHDHRAYVTVRWDPKLFGPEFATSFKVKYENGNIKANRPRIIPPRDSITPWFKPLSEGGMGRYQVTDPYVMTSVPKDKNTWIDVIANVQQPVWSIDGATGTVYSRDGGYIHTGAIQENGGLGNVSQGIQNLNYVNSPLIIRSYSSYATEAKLPGYLYGQYRDYSLTDASIFDFYHNLIDGNTKSEWEDWNAYNFSFSQTGWGDRVGVAIDYDYQSYKRGGQGLLSNPSLTMDYTKTNLDGTPNKNYGRPFVSTGAGSGSSYASDRRFFRASLYGELRATDFFGEGLVSKLIGKHRFNGSYSKERFFYENRGWQMVAYTPSWGAYWQRDPNTAINDRPPVAMIYLGNSVAGRGSLTGANIPGITGDIVLTDGPVYCFDETWTATGVNYKDPWTIPTSIRHEFATNFSSPTQASNPANYVGWNSNKTLNLMRYDDEDTSLLTSAYKSIRQTESYAGTWQGFMLNDAVVGTFGWRYDKVSGKDVNAQQVKANRKMLNMTDKATADARAYVLPDEFPESQIFRKHSTSWSVVAHLNKFLPHDFLPLNVSLTYNKSNNFRITGVRRDVYGDAIGNPTGDTKEYGILLSTKDGKYSFRALKYETKMTGVTVEGFNNNALGSTVAGGLSWRNVFLYRLSAYTWDKREDPYPSDYGKGYSRNTWHPAWIDNTTGRLVAAYGGYKNPDRAAADVTADLKDPPANAHFETRAEAVAHRDACINAWNNIQRYLDGKGYFKAWGYNPTTLSALTDRSTYEAALTEPAGAVDSILGKGGHRDPANPNTILDVSAPQYTPNPDTVNNYSASNPGFAVTSDTSSEGYEFEFTANPLPNWRIAINASKTTANRVNVGGAVLDEFVAYMDAAMSGVAGDMRRWNGDAGSEIRTDWFGWRSNYTLLKLNENAAASEIRKWRYNIITNYDFTEGFLKGVGVGAAYRWQDKVVIGYPVLAGAGDMVNYDLTNPIYGPAEDGLDLWVSYTRQLSDKVEWKIQLNVRNAFDGDGLIPISTEPDGSYASVRIKPVQEWFITNTFTF